MNNLALFKDTLDKILFLEIDKSIFFDIFNVEVKDNIFLPMHSSRVISDIKGNKDLKDLDFRYLIQGMFYVLGCDEEFKYNELYITLLKSKYVVFSQIVKGAIASFIKEKIYIDAYILLKGFSRLEENDEIYSKLVWLADTIRTNNSDFKEEELYIIEKGKVLNFSTPYFYEAMLHYEEKKYEKALLSINNYIEKGGHQTTEVCDFKIEVQNMSSYENGKEMLYDKPIGALELLLPLLDETENNAVLHYYIGVAYRLIQNYEKAIFYLNEALYIDVDLVDVVNELGLSYACLGNYEIAIKYFNKAFEASNSIEICTNLTMCYMNMNKNDMARMFLEKAKKLNPHDEIVIQLASKLKGEK